jgi:hypothetical protein
MRYSTDLSSGILPSRPSRYRHSGEGRNPAARESANLLGGA